MQRCLLALAGCSAFLPRAPRIVRPQPELRESAGDDFLLDLFAEADERVVDDTPDRPPRNYDQPYAEHDYERAQDDDGASVDEAAVDALLAERVQMKRRRLFDEADAIRDELQRVHGVSVWDRERVWRTGRGGGRNQRQRGPPRSLPACGHDYECGNSDSSQSGMSVDEIDAILAERLQCKFRRDFQRADALQEELFSTGPRDNQMLTPCSTSTPSTRRRLDGVEVLRHRRDVVPVTAEVHRGLHTQAWACACTTA